MTETLTPFKDAKYLPVEEALKQLKAYTPKPSTTENESCLITDVDIAGFKYDVEWLTEESEDKTLDEWVSYAAERDLAIPPIALYHRCMKKIKEYESLFHVPNEKYNLWQELLNDFRRPMLTHTLIYYAGIDRISDGKTAYAEDTVVHNYIISTRSRIVSSETIAKDITGESEEALMDRLCKSFLCGDSPQYADEMYTGLFGQKPTFVLPLLKDLGAKEQRIATMGRQGNVFTINANVPRDLKGPAHLVRMHRK
jgi:hypothetical protein